MELILASNSPRRKELLQKGGYSFKIISSDYEESLNVDDPILTATTFAKGKAQSVFDRIIDKENVIVIGADTVVYHNGEILGKPKTEQNAIEMLKSLSGNLHSVITGYAIIGNGINIVGHAESKVEFNVLSDNVIERYILSKLYQGKAGSYGIQDGYGLVKNCIGSVDNVIGLPTEKIFPILDRYLKKQLY